MLVVTDVEQFEDVVEAVSASSYRVYAGKWYVMLYPAVTSRNKIKALVKTRGVQKTRHDAIEVAESNGIDVIEVERVYPRERLEKEGE